MFIRWKLALALAAATSSVTMATTNRATDVSSFPTTLPTGEFAERVVG
jgi:hypothetical protein